MQNAAIDKLLSQRRSSVPGSSQLQESQIDRIRQLLNARSQSEASGEPNFKQAVFAPTTL